MGQAGDLLLIFADALARSWKQVVHFRPAGFADSLGTNGSVKTDAALDQGDGAATVASPLPVASAPPAAPISDDFILVRDERGVHLARETED
jgi:cyanophycin synthetase